MAFFGGYLVSEFCGNRKLMLIPWVTTGEVVMTCRCRSIEEHEARERAAMAESYAYEVKKLKKELEALRADISSFEIQNIFCEGGYLVLMVKYLHPDGRVQKGCTFEGVKVLVYEDVSVKDVVFWKKIDPHFSNPALVVRASMDAHSLSPKEAPSPFCRFRGDDKGWTNAIDFVKFLSSKRS